MDWEIRLNNDGTFAYKTEYTYDSNGNKATSSTYVFINNEWAKGWIQTDEYYYKENKSYVAWSITLYHGALAYKTEYTYDENGNKATISTYEFINEAWVQTEEESLVGNKMCTIWKIILEDDKTISSKYEYTYDENGNKIIEIESYYKNDAWVYNYKNVYTYDENGNMLTRTYYRYINGEWVES